MLVLGGGGIVAFGGSCKQRKSALMFVARVIISLQQRVRCILKVAMRSEFDGVVCSEDIAVCKV